ncbi:MAG: M48 family metallopeptidase [Deltaproteobacteria bacterium]|nr:M48 family metallopeptidase [Deltaproteobacteria bacterium]
MTKRARIICVFIIVSFFLFACTTVPITGRKQLNLIPAQTMLSLSLQQYDEFLKAHTVSTDEQQTALVNKVGGRVKAAVEQYFTENRMSSTLKEFEWEFNLIESEEINAWCMPGGKVVVYTGILPYTQDEQGLAVVMGHEIGHAVAQHGSERMSQMLAVQLGGMALSVALSDKPEETKKLWMIAFGLGSQVGFILPYSRLQENEADRLGLTFMAMAGYDPNGAVSFWERMSEKQGGKSPPEFISTHPSDQTRIRNIKALIPQVMPYYEQAKTKG